jgi:pimeloyl-ACP methyl ester carboxylesterase
LWLLPVLVGLLSIGFDSPVSAKNGKHGRTGSEIVCDSVTTLVPSVDNGPADVEMAGTLCYPSWRTPGTVQLLVHGATYTQTAWDWPQKPALYSYVRAAVTAGYATFSVDRLGHGHSAHPPSETVSLPAGATALHGIVTKLRAGNLGGRAFTKVVWVGHSLGAVTAYEYGGRYADIDAYALTGSIHFMKQSWLGLIQSNLQPAGPDPGYLTTVPGSRAQLFYFTPTADPTVIALDEATKDTVTGAEFQTGVPLVFVPAAQSPTQRIHVPVLVELGQHDNIVCDGPDGLTCTNTAIQQFEQPYFTNATRFDVAVIPGSGHLLSQHFTAPIAHLTLLKWAFEVAPPV